MGIAIDFSAVTTFEPVPADTYECVFTVPDKDPIRQNKAKDGLVFNAHFIIENTSKELDGHRLFRGYSLKPQALWALKECLLECGVDEDSFTDDADLEELLNDANGAHVLVTCTLEPNTNNPEKMFNNVTSVKANQ